MTENLVSHWVLDGDGSVIVEWTETEDTALCDREIDAKGQE